MRLLLDSNIILRLSDTSHNSHGLAVEAIERLHRDGHDCVLVPQVIYEYWVVATRPIAVHGLSMEVAEVNVSATAWTSQFTLLRDEGGLYERWRTTVVAAQVKGTPAHDARLVAAMLRHGVTHLLTFNTVDFKRFTDIVAISPDEVVAGRLPA